MEAASIAHGHEEHHGPPPANRSSRVEPQLLGMLLFIISEVMVFGAFFTAYFFIRVAQGDPWPALGTQLPVAVARELIKTGYTAQQVTGFRGRSGRSFRARLAMSQTEDGKWRVEFDEEWAKEGAKPPEAESDASELPAASSDGAGRSEIGQRTAA